jgi:glycosyltransferase involved in cell wall biosynthesis
MLDLTVITVVKNDSQNILNTVNSVLKQKNCKFEYIICDGNSSDTTANRLKKYNSKKINFFRQRDKNLYDAINKCIIKSKGNYIFLIHSGDVFCDDFVLQKIQKQLIKNPDLISGNIKYFKKYNNRNLVTRIWKSPIKNFNKFSVFKIPHTSMVIKKKIIKKINYYNTSYNISGDMDFMIKLSQLKKINYIYLNSYFVFMLFDGLSTSRKNFFKKLIQDFKILIENYGFNFLIYYFFKIYFKVFQYLRLKH